MEYFTLYKPLEAFRKNAARLMQAQKLNQTQAARFLGWDQGNLSAYLKKREPGLAKIAEFAEKFGVSVAEMLTDPTQSQIEPRIIEHDAGECARRSAALLGDLGMMDADERELVIQSISGAAAASRARSAGRESDTA